MVDTNNTQTTTQLPIRHLAIATSKLLGYTVAPEELGDFKQRDVAELHGPDEIRLFWFSPWRPKDRIEILGQFPRWYDEFSTETYHSRERFNITIAKGSSPEHAAREIKRRLLPGYLVQLEEAKQLRAQFFERGARQEQIMKRLEAVGARRAGRERGSLEIVLDSSEGMARYGDIKVGNFDGTVDIKLRNLSPEQATAVLRALAASTAAS
ncbi:MAG TPA: hypothetical protein VJT73_03650 [Polyangiaceae bacterium]|nr:hypothetical protein [Polyangiaceae bacterium]